jgi:hypothetical protein
MDVVGKLVSEHDLRVGLFVYHLKLNLSKATAMDSIL